MLVIREYSGTLPHDHPVYTTTLLLHPGFYGPMVVALMGFHSIYYSTMFSVFPCQVRENSSVKMEQFMKDLSTTTKDMGKAN